MEGHENSASRLHDFFAEMLRHPINNSNPTQMQFVLMRSFGVDPQLLTRREQATWTMRILSLLYVEYDALVLAAKSGHKTERTYAPIAEIFTSHLDIRGVLQSWEQVRGTFEKAQHALLIFAEFFPDDCEKIAASELDEIKSQALHLWKMVSSSALPDYVKQFITEQLTIIVRAIEDYRIAGPKVFKSAIREAAFHDVDHSEEIKDYQETEEITKLKELQGAVCKYSKYTIEFSKFLAACTVVGTSIAETTTILGPYIAALTDKAQLLLK